MPEYFDFSAVLVFFLVFFPSSQTVLQSCYKMQDMDIRGIQDVFYVY